MADRGDPAALAALFTFTPRIIGRPCGCAGNGNAARSEGVVERDGRERFAMTPESVARIDCDACVKLFVVLDLKQGAGDRPYRGMRALAEDIGWGNDRVYRHLAHLESRGLVTVEKHGQHKVTFRVHNPARTGTPVFPPQEHQAGTPVFPPREHECSHDRNTYVPTTGTLSSSALKGEFSNQRDPRTTGNGDLGRCDVCGKRWAYGPCAHGAAPTCVDCGASLTRPADTQSGRCPRCRLRERTTT